VDYCRDVQVCAVLAMAQQRLGQTNAARAAFDQAKETAETRLSTPGNGNLGPDWNAWIISYTLLREAQALIEAPIGAGDHARAEQK
jgi:hypothetical protein